ncbi:MAG TPA: RNA polymerase factor sigma-54 [Chthoniobacteraceae bacterium]|nr:RNA polymerase factor sigma-54 [Chthoniobacteraceae bacterium]
MAGMQQVQNLSMQQALAPQLQQSLQILQAPVLELRTLVQNEIAINPVIEEESTEPSLEDKQRELDEFQQEFDHLAKLDDEWRDYMAQSSAYSHRSAQADEKRRQFFFDSLVEGETLQQHLLDQLRGEQWNTADRRTAELIIGNIDETGFLQSSLEEMAQNTGLEEKAIARVLARVQEFHPVGVAARDLKECLLIQLRRLGKEGSIEEKIVRSHLEDLGKRRFPEIARRLGTTVEQVQKSANFIATLDPRPGQLFTADPNHYVLPDVSVEKIGGEWQISLNGEQIPHLRISNTYKDLMAKDGNPSEVRDYIREKIRSGKFLIKSIHQRQQTISNIAREIVARQKAFFEEGPTALQPMTMVLIADAVGVHETTVSRAISGKYMATPWGVYEMKYFFTPGYQTSDGVQMSNTSVKNAISELVRQESPKNPLSDKEIVDILTERGIPIARRTVAKYRAELGILPSTMRRTF